MVRCLNSIKICVLGLNGKSCESHVFSGPRLEMSDSRFPFSLIFFCRLFAFPTPTLVPPDYKPGQRLQMSHEIGEQMAIRGRNPRYRPATSRGERFRQHVKEVLTLQDLQKSLSIWDAPWRFYRATRVFQGFLSWTSYAIQVAFPILTLVSICLVYSDAYCTLHLGNCTFQSSSTR